MIVDDQTLDLANSIEGLLDDLSEVPMEGEVKPELMESVCEIATTPTANAAEAGAQLKALRRQVQQVAAQRLSRSVSRARSRSRAPRAVRPTCG